MGGSGSKRQIIVEDAGPDGVVTVTEEVVRRLKGLPDKPDTDKQSKSNTPPPSNTPPANHPSLWREHSTKESAPRMKEVEDFYVQKLKDLQERNAALQKQTNEHFATAVKEVEHKFMNFSASPVCQELQMKVMECYQANPKNTLNCSPIVSAFTACVDKARMASSASRLRNVS